jgi:hypothetical protein
MNRQEYAAKVEGMSDSALEEEGMVVSQKLQIFQRAVRGSSDRPTYQQYAQKVVELYQDRASIIQTELSER